MEFPQKGEMLFRSERECHLNACVGPYHTSLTCFGRNYKEAADQLLLAAANGDLLIDRAIYPAVFLYRQYVELALKDIISLGRRLERGERGYPHIHSLPELWREAKRLVRDHYGPDAPPELDNVDNCIAEFDAHDPQSMAFRYPTNKEGEWNLQKLRHINLRTLYNAMERIANLLNGLSSDMGWRVDMRREMEREMSW